MRTDEELKEIAKDFHAGKIFSDRHCQSLDEVRSSFLVLLFMDPEKIKDLEKKEIDFIFQYLEQAERRSVNGRPIFLSMQCLTKAETAKMFEYYEKIKAAMAAI